MTFRRYIFRSRVFALNVVAAVVLPLTELTVRVEWGVKLYSLTHWLTVRAEAPSWFFWGERKGLGRERGGPPPSLETHQR